jgi:hypothetical protein
MTISRPTSGRRAAPRTTRCLPRNA